jgi:DNA-binding NarL/FixJ family response regulator
MEHLSARQEQLLPLLLQDLRMKDIAARLNLGQTTVDTYAKALYRKHKVTGRIGLILKLLGTANGQTKISQAPTGGK